MKTIPASDKCDNFKLLGLCSVYFLSVKVIQHLVDVVEQTKVQGHYQVFCVLVKFG